MDDPFDDDGDRVFETIPSHSTPSPTDCEGSETDCFIQMLNGTINETGNNYLNITTEIPIEYGN